MTRSLSLFLLKAIPCTILATFALNAYAQGDVATTTTISPAETTVSPTTTATAPTTTPTATTTSAPTETATTTTAPTEPATQPAKIKKHRKQKVRY